MLSLANLVNQVVTATETLTIRCWKCRKFKTPEHFPNYIHGSQTSLCNECKPKVNDDIQQATI